MLGDFSIRPMMRGGNGRAKTMPYPRAGHSFTTESDSDEDSSSITRNKRGRSLFRRFADKFSSSKSRAASQASARAQQMRNDSAQGRSSAQSRVSSQARTSGRPSSISARSMSDYSSASSAGRSSSSTASKATSFSSNEVDPRLQKRMSLLSLTNPTSQLRAENTPRVAKRSVLQHGPTMSAKRGIEQEWELYRTLPDWYQHHGSEQQRLGHQLLLGQLLSKTDLLGGHDVLPSNVTVDMLVTRWTTVPRRETIASSSQPPSMPQKPSQGSTGFPQMQAPPLDVDRRIRNAEFLEQLGLAGGIRREQMQRVRKEQSVPALYRGDIAV